MRITIFLVLFVFLSMMLVGQALFESEVDMPKVQKALVWNSSSFEVVQNNISSLVDYNGYGTRVSNIVNKGLDFAGFTAFEVAKGGLEFGYWHPEYNYEHLVVLVKYLVLATIILALIPSIIPLAALTYIIWIGLVKLFKWLYNKCLRLKSEC